MKSSEGSTLPFDYLEGRFADIQLLRYRLNGFEQLSLLKKKLIYYLSEATLFGRDITFDQNGRYNLRIRKTLEAVYMEETIPHDTEEFQALEVYLKRIRRDGRATMRQSLSCYLRYDRVAQAGE